MPDPTNDADPQLPMHPSDMLLAMVITFLTPMFVTAANGSVEFARVAAVETVNAYRARTQADVIAVAQIVAFGLAALGSLCLSMADDLSVSMVLKLRANANACNRSAEQNRRHLQEHPPNLPPNPPQPEPITAAEEAVIIAGVAEVQRKATEVRKTLATPQPSPPQQPAPQTPASEQPDFQHMWAAAAAHVAGEYAADLPNLPPEQRRAASMRAAMLSSCANDLLSRPPIPRMRPTELAAALRADGALERDRLSLTQSEGVNHAIKQRVRP